MKEGREKRLRSLVVLQSGQQLTPRSSLSEETHAFWPHLCGLLTSLMLDSLCHMGYSMQELFLHMQLYSC
jgi:hypothetical protein